FVGAKPTVCEPPGVRLSRVTQLIDKGLRAQLRSGNLLTGQLYVALDFFPDAPKARGDPTAKKPPEIPTIAGTFEELQNNLANVMKKLDKLQIEEIGADTRKLIASLDETLKGVDSLLQGADTLVKRVDSDLMPDLRRALDNAGRALDSAGATLNSANAVLGSESPLQSDLRQTLMEVNRTLAAIRALAASLERHRESLIRGKQASASPWPRFHAEQYPEELAMAADRSYVTKNREQLDRLRALVDKLSDQELAKPMEAGWTVAAVLAHLAFWDYRIVTLLDRWNAGGTPPSSID